MMSLREVDVRHAENDLRETFLGDNDDLDAYHRHQYYPSSTEKVPYDQHDKSSTSEDESYELLSARETLVFKNDLYKRKSHFDGFLDSMQPGSVKGSVFTMTIAVVGAGILSLPYAIKQSGVVLGIGLILLFAGITRFSIGIILKAADILQASSFAELAKMTSGPKLEVFTMIVIAFNLFGTSVGYIVGSTELLQLAMNSLDPDFAGFDRRGLVAFLCFVVILPFSLCQSLGSLRYASLIAVICIVYMTITIVVKYFQFVSWGYAPSMKYQLDHLTLFETDVVRLLEAVPLIIFVYTCHPNVMPICSVLKRPSTCRIHKVVDRSLGIATVIYAFCGVFVVFTFGKATQSNFLRNNYHHDIAMAIGAIGFSIALVLTVPLFVHTMGGIVKSVDARMTALPIRQRIVSCILVVSVMLTSMCATNIASVLSILGTTTNPIICFILPAIIAHSIRSDAMRIQRRVAGCIAILMSMICIASFIANFGK